MTSVMGKFTTERRSKVGWGEDKTHPLISGKTPLELEQMDYTDLLAHKVRVEQYLRKIEDEVMIHSMIRDHETGRSTLTERPVLGLSRYKDLWRIARKRVGLDA